MDFKARNDIRAQLIPAASEVDAILDERLAKAQPIDKSAWGPGPWQAEPDRVEFEHLGLPCLIVRHERAGHLCGYVAVPPGHPWHGKNDSTVYDLPDDKRPDAHGGITYASACAGHVCHVPKPGEPDDVWWIGFDAAHAGDVSPGYEWALSRVGVPTGWGGVHDYRTVDYMRRQCERLAEQARAVGP
jgi:hypothetical protein